jgi:hypothetical protein
MVLEFNTVFSDVKPASYYMETNQWTLTESLTAEDFEVWCVISGFRREVGESCALLSSYAASSGNSLQTFRDDLSVPSSSSHLKSHSCITEDVSVHVKRSAESD